MFDLTLTEQIEIDAPLERVWHVFSDIRAWPQWNSVCLKVDRLEGELWIPGFRFHMVLRIAGLRVPFRPTVVQAEVPHRVVWSSVYFTVTGQRTFVFHATEGGTLVVDEKRFSSRVLPIGALYPRFAISRMSRQWLGSLKQEVERRWDG